MKVVFTCTDTTVECNLFAAGSDCSGEREGLLSASTQSCSVVQVVPDGMNASASTILTEVFCVQDDESGAATVGGNLASVMVAGLSLFALVTTK